MKVKPLSDRVVIEPLEAEDKTSGGIYLPDTAKEKPARGTIVAIGDGKLMPNGKLHKLVVKPGDKVLFSQYSGTEVKVDDEKVPECCGKTMKEVPLDPCLQPAHAEHARPMEDEDACDNFRAGK